MTTKQTKPKTNKKGNTTKKNSKTKHDIFIEEDDVVLHNYIYSTLSEEAKIDYDNIFGGYDMDLFYEAVAEATGVDLDEHKKRQALKDFNTIKTILVMLQKSQFLAENIDSLLASIILNVKTAILMGEDKIRELGNMCALFAIHQAEEIIERLDDVNSDIMLSEEEKTAIVNVKVDLDAFLGNKEAYIQDILEQSHNGTIEDVDDSFYDAKRIIKQNNKENIN